MTLCMQFMGKLLASQSWCLCAAVPIEQEGEGPKRGALFNQLVKELRSEYAAAVTACAQRIHSALADHRCSIRAALEKYGITNDSAVLMEQVTALCALKQLCPVFKNKQNHE